MAAVALSSIWIPEDDLLLKNSIEAGASLEALAKGAVQFSRRFTFQELQDRWYTLLYDPDISAQASARMGDLQRSASNLSSELNRSDKAKQIPEKRKFASIRKQYYAMRKRIRNEFFSSTDLGFLPESNLHNYSGNGGDFHEHATLDNGPSVGNCEPNHFRLQETDFDILRHAFPETMAGIAATNDVANIGEAFHYGGPDSLANNHMSRVARNNCLHELPEDVSSLSIQGSLRNDGTKSFPRYSAHKDIPQNLDNNLADLGKISGVEEMGSSKPLPETNLFETDGSDVKPLSTFESTNNKLHNDGSEFGGTQHLSSPNSDGSASLHTMGFSPLMPTMPLWKTMEDVSAPAIPVNVSPGDEKQCGEEISEQPDNDDGKRKGSPEHGVINSTALSDGEFADLSEALLDFSNEDELLFMDVDGTSTVDKSCSLLLSSPIDANGGDAPEVEPKKLVASNTGLAAASSVYAADSEVLTSPSQIHSVHGDQQRSYQSGVNFPSTSVLNSNPLELNLGSTYCTLNTEDTEIPCNDDIFLLIHPSASLTFPASRPTTISAIDPSSSANEKDTEQGLNFLSKGEDPGQLFMPSQMIGGPKHALSGCTVKSELPDPSCAALAPRDANKANGDSQCKCKHTTPNAAIDGMLEKDVVKTEFGVVDMTGTFGEMSLHAEASFVELTLPESLVNLSPSDQEEPESDNDMAYFSDIEAMILEMDLGACDHDSYFTSRVSRHQSEDSKKKIIRLEQCSQSSLQRSMTCQGAFAIFYGRRLKHFIRKTEVRLGRSTEEVQVDIDLGKEGRANKISRHQANINMNRDGSFVLQNFGKTSISVNGKEVASGQSLGLSSSCLIEIRGMSFIFEVNHKTVRRYLDNIAKKSQVTNFEWLPEDPLVS
ncbi:Microspherule protein [Actinidia chinensis var. chinensis]|uniref:Microspherule protein n=1 Tax=Actinidia chinensis var. chinensis TaxID=1590841 RepID=A0A2R6S2M5_ACTCC|nr:Microspherule protein [Actinidia chinensis var. chinensis]